MKNETNSIAVATQDTIGKMPKWKQHLTKIKLAEKSVAELKVTDEKSMTEALELQREAKDSAKEIDSLRDFIVRPHNDAVRAANALFKPAVDRLKEVATVIDRKVRDFRAEQNRKAAEEEARIERERLAKEAKLKAAGKMQETQTLAVPKAVVEAAPKAVPKTVAVGKTKATFVKYKKFEIVNPELLPGRFLKPDEVAIGKAVRSGELDEIPGVRIWEEESVR